MLFRIIVVTFSIIFNVTVVASGELETLGKFQHPIIMSMKIDLTIYDNLAGSGVLNIRQKHFIIKNVNDNYIHIAQSNTKVSTWVRNKFANEADDIKFFEIIVLAYNKSEMEFVHYQFLLKNLWVKCYRNLHLI